MHLHVVRPVVPGQVTDPPKRRRRGIPSPSLSLTPDEARCLRASVRGIARTRYGTLAKLAGALGVVPGILTRKRIPSPGLAVAVWRLTGIPVETLLSAKLAAVPSTPSTIGGAS
jgi:hypothetical protein